MARLFSSGWELQSLTSYVEFLPVVGAGTNSIDTTTKRSGNASWRNNPSASYSFLEYQFRASGTSKVLARVYIKVATLPSTNRVGILSLGTTGASATGAEVWLETDGTLTLGYYSGGRTQIGSPSSAVNDGNWHLLEIMYDDDTDTAEGRLDGSSFASGASANLGGFTFLQVGGILQNETMDIYFDDLAINDTSGTYQTSWPGSGKIIHLHPNAAGDANDCSSGDYSSVDEVTPDDASTIAVLNDNGDVLDVNIESSSTGGIGASDTITLVQVGSRDNCASAAAASYYQRVKSQTSGTTLEGTLVTHNDTTYKTAGMGEGSLYGYLLTSYVDPQAGGSWTPSLLDSAQIGVRAIDAEPDINLTTLWLLVEYVEGTPVGTSIKDVITEDSIIVFAR